MYYMFFLTRMADKKETSGYRFEGKVAIVTGGCRGIGQGCADILAENGGTVVILDKKDPGLGVIDDISITDFKELLNINLIANFTASKYALPHIRQTRGSIVNISSISGVIANASSPTYCASKGAVISLTKALAIDEAKHGVRVNAIAPGPVNTPMLNAVMKKAGDVEGITKAMKECNHLKRIADPREIAQACLFLAVDATFTTGEVLMCSAGNEIGYGVK